MLRRRWFRWTMRVRKVVFLEERGKGRGGKPPKGKAYTLGDGKKGLEGREEGIQDAAEDVEDGGEEGGEGVGYAGHGVSKKGDGGGLGKVWRFG